MATDWLVALTAAGERAKHAAADVPQHLTNPNLSEKDIAALYAATENCAQEMERLLNEIVDDDDVDDALVEAAEALQNIWDSLSLACASRLREIQGLPPLDFADEFDDDNDDGY